MYKGPAAGGPGPLRARRRGGGQRLKFEVFKAVLR